MQQPPSILVYGREPALLQSRTWVLQTAGFQVAPAGSLAEVLKVSGKRSIDLLVLCHTLSPAECREVLAWADSYSDIKRLVLTSGVVPSGHMANGEILSPFAGPRELIASAQRLLPAPGIN